MTATMDAKSIRETVDHPIVDADAHVLEYVPTLWEFLEAEGGAGLVDFHRSGRSAGSENARTPKGPFYGAPIAKMVDFATAHFPALLEERREELGLDYLFLYPTAGLPFPHYSRREHRIPSCRAINRYMAEMYKSFSHSMCPVGMIPMHTPEEAIEEADYALSLGLKAFVLAGHVRRPFRGEDVTRGTGSFWVDTFGIDSPYDYDPVWAHFEKVGIAPSFHSGSISWTNHRSPSNYVFNHVLHFADANCALAKSLFLGGVTERFPKLNFSFLEGGAGWACTLLGSLVEHWQLRNLETTKTRDPANFSMAEFDDYFQKYAPEQMRPQYGEIGVVQERMGKTITDEAFLDDFRDLEIGSKNDLVEKFVKPFYFGCEADDTTAAWAFKKEFNPRRSQLKAMFSSDLGHWDVADMSDVVCEGYELLEEGLMDADAFRAYTFENAVSFHTRNNPDFFDGTTVGDAVKALSKS